MANFAAIRNLFICRGIGSPLLPAALFAKKACCSSGPVRFIPGQFSQIKKTPKSSSLQDSSYKDDTKVHMVPVPGNHATGLSDLDGRLLQNSHFFDDEKTNLSYIEIGGSLRIDEYNDPGEVLDTDNENDNELNTIPKAIGDGLKKTREEIEQVAVNLLAARAMTVTELRKKLRGKKYPFNIVESVVVDFKSRGLLNDGLYAESFTRSRWLSSTWGPRRIKQALLQKGVTLNETESARKHVFEGDADPECKDGGGMRHGMCKLSMDRLFLQASKQWLRSMNTCIDKRRARIVRWLQYRGFDWEVVSYILKKLESQYPT